MENNELISVIVPVYNCEQYVAETLDSIINQTYRNLEIMVIDDGSTDGSPAICDSYTTDSRVQVFHRQNAGVALSRQFGVDNCHGAYYVTLDSDDFVATDYVEKLYRTIKENDADISVCGVSCFTDSPDKITAVCLPEGPGGKLTITPKVLSSEFYRISCDLILTDSGTRCTARNLYATARCDMS